MALHSIDIEGIVDKLDMVEDWVLIEKVERLDSIDKVGSIHVPGTVNMNIRESKIGIIRACGKGSVSGKGRVSTCDAQVGSYCYYTRYGKQVIEGLDGGTWVVTRNRGVLAYIILDANGMPEAIHPRFDRLLVKEIKRKEYITDAGIVIKFAKLDRDDYRRYQVLQVGPGILQRGKEFVAEYISCQANPGDVVYSSNQNGVIISWNHRGKREEFRLVPEAECVAIEKAGQEVNAS